MVVADTSTTATNNLSFPVIAVDGFSILPVTDVTHRAVHGHVLPAWPRPRNTTQTYIDTYLEVYKPLVRPEDGEQVAGEKLTP